MSKTNKDTVVKQTEPRVVLWDIETSGIVATTWNLYPESIHHSNMLHDWFIISGAWKELGSSKTHAVSLLDDSKRFNKDHTDDYYVVKALRDMLEGVDILIHHNGDRFDCKAFNARLIYHRLPPLPKLVTVDTLKEVKKIAKFTSNRLDFLGKIFTGQGKEETPPGTWLKAMSGDKTAIKNMVRYNKVDVTKLEEIYLRLRPYIVKHPNIAVLKGGQKHECPKCGSSDVFKHSVAATTSGTLTQRMGCKDCKGFHSVPFKQIK